MPLKTFRKQHKWLGIPMGILLIFFCLSGIILNHRIAFSTYDISRKWLPRTYQYQRWNNGLLRGTIPFQDSILVYGSSGVFCCNRQGKFLQEWNTGLPTSADLRQIRALLQLPNGELWALTAEQVFRWHQHRWQAIQNPLPNERLSDLTLRHDTLIVVGRSHLAQATSPYTQFTPLTLAAPQHHNHKVSLFRTIWLLHSGALYGTLGRLFVDAIALILLLIVITGLLFWLCKKTLPHTQASWIRSTFKQTYHLHDLLGRTTIIAVVLIVLTGWMLRPPLLLTIARAKITPPPGSTLQSSNAWNDKLRMLRYDSAQHLWLLSTSEGIYTLPHLAAIPQKATFQPPISVMGLNVWQAMSPHRWVIGSFQGMYIWDTQRQQCFDFTTGKRIKNVSPIPLGQLKVSGYSQDFATSPFYTTIDNGTEAIPMPNAFKNRPMSLWNIALEIHTGRFFLGLGAAQSLYIFFVGLLSLWAIWSGWKIRKRKRR